MVMVFFGSVAPQRTRGQGKIGEEVEDADQGLPCACLSQSVEGEHLRSSLANIVLCFRSQKSGPKCRGTGPGMRLNYHEISAHSLVSRPHLVGFMWSFTLSVVAWGLGVAANQEASQVQM